MSCRSYAFNLRGNCMLAAGVGIGKKYGSRVAPARMLSVGGITSPTFRWTFGIAEIDISLFGADLLTG